MIDWLALWGATTAVGLVFKPILEDLAKGAAEDFVKEILGDSLKSVLRPGKDPRTVALGTALKDFLQLVQDELESADLDEEHIGAFIEPLKRLVRLPEMKEALGAPFRQDGAAPSGAALAAAWHTLDPSPPALPDRRLVGPEVRRACAGRPATFPRRSGRRRRAPVGGRRVRGFTVGARRYAEKLRGHLKR